MKKFFWIVSLLLALGIGVWFLRSRQAVNPAAGTSGGGGAGAGRRGGGGAGGPGGGGPVLVVAGTVEKKDMPIFLDGLGTVQAFNLVTVRARVDGELTKVVFTEGQEVKKGDLLAVIDPRPLQAQVDQAVAKKAQDEAQLANARLVLGRNEELLKRKVLDQQTFDTARFQADQLAATVAGDQAALDNARTQLSYTQITAPIDGRVGVRQVDQGNIVRASDQNGIVVIAQLHPVSVVFTLAEANVRDINRQAAAAGENNPLKVVAVDRANTTPLGEGKLAVVDNQIDQTTGTIKLKATFSNEDNNLWPGQFVNARLLLTTRPDAAVVPASVVQRGPNGAYAFLIKPDQTVEMRPVKVAQTEAGEALIEDGLQPGDHVVVDGQYKLQPGSKVEVQGAPAGRPRGPGGDRALGKGGKPDDRRSATPGS